MVPNDLETAEIPVSKRETIHTFRQTIRPPDQVSIARLLEALVTVLRSGRFTGHVTMNLNQGGVRDIVTEQKVTE